MQLHCTYLMGRICQADDQRCCNIVTKQLVRIMKLVAILLTVFFLQVKADGFSQGTVTYSGENVPLEKLVAAIKHQTGYSFFYTEDVWANAKPVTINVKSVPVMQVLQLVFKNQPISYYVEEKVIILSKKTEQWRERLKPESAKAIIDIRGKVTGENGSGLEGVNVVVKGTNIGTRTDLKGDFELKGVDDSSILVFSYIGYEKHEVFIKNNGFVINVRLKMANGNLDEVQVIGYGTTTKRLNTGNVATVKSVDIEKQPVSNPLLALQGRMSGVQVDQATGLPGSGVRLQIRGRNSIASGNEPLYVIDGVPYPSLNLINPLQNVLGSSGLSGTHVPGSPFSYINPSDIESIDVLKDADATAIYGTRGANGVVLITTKKGKQGKLTVSLNVQNGFGKVANRVNVLNTRQYLDMRYEAFKNDGATPNPNVDYDLTLWDTTSSTDWQKVLIGGTAKYTDFQSSISGGNEYLQYRVGVGYHNETTVFPSDFGNRKTSGQFNITGVSDNKKFQMSFSGMYMKDNNQIGSYDFTDQAVKLAPIAPALYNSDGSVNWAPNANGVSTWNIGQPIAMTFIRVNSKTNNLVSNSVLSFKPISKIEIKSSFGYSILHTNDIKQNPHSSVDPFMRGSTPRSSSFVDNEIESWIVEPQFVYSSKFFGGDINALIGTTFQQKRSIGRQVAATGFTSDLLLENLGAATSVIASPSTDLEYKYNALFGRITYNHSGKYIVNLTGRRDGSSRFGPANQFHNFGAIGIAWIFSKESVIKRLLPVISFGKVRFSYGTTGNDEVGDYSFMDIYVVDPVGVPYQGAQGIIPNRMFTPDLAWEKTKKIEAGFDLTLFGDAIELRVSAYRNRSSNQLMSYPLPSTSGFSSINRNLDALVQNSGLEFEVKCNVINGTKFRWNNSLNLSTNRNKLLSVAKEISDVYGRRIGMPISAAIVYQYLGVDVISGQYQVSDINGNVTSTPKILDAKVAITNPNPKFIGGFENNIAWGGFQVDFLVQFVFNVANTQYLYNGLPGYFSRYGGSNQPVTVLNRWQKPGDVAPIQRFSQNLSTLSAYENANNSDKLYQNVSYARLKNVSISWEIPKKWKVASHIKYARLFTRCQNLFTVTNYKGLDPESSSGEMMRLPPLRIITFGMQLSF